MQGLVPYELLLPTNHGRVEQFQFQFVQVTIWVNDVSVPLSPPLPLPEGGNGIQQINHPFASSFHLEPAVPMSRGPALHNHTAPARELPGMGPSL